MDVFEESYQNIKWDLLSVYKSEYILIYVIGIMWLIGLISGYAGFASTMIGILIWFGSIIYGIYMLDILFGARYSEIFVDLKYKAVRIIISLLLFSILYFVSDVQIGIFLILLLLGVVWRLDSRIWAVFAMGSLFWVIMMLLFDMQWRAEAIAVWLYYFLVISVVCGLIWGGKNKSEEI